MKDQNKTLELKLERTIAASPAEAFDAWLNPKVPGTPWNMGDKLILNAKVDGLFYWLVGETPHYGRFTELTRGSRIAHTWMSPYTNGVESTVTVNFRKAGKGTLMTLVHSGLPNQKSLRAHQKGWTHFLDQFPQQFVGATRSA